MLTLGCTKLGAKLGWGLALGTENLTRDFASIRFFYSLPSFNREG